MIFNQLFDPKSHTYTYIISSGQGREALIVDPVIEKTDEYLKILEDNYIDEDGKRYPLIKDAAPAKIIFNLDDRLTNSTCAGDWAAENVLKCSLFRNNVKVKDIEFSGEADFAPGTYQVKCIQANDGRQVSSETRVCRLNPDVRER